MSRTIERRETPLPASAVERVEIVRTCSNPGCGYEEAVRDFDTNYCPYCAQDLYCELAERTELGAPA